MKNMQIVLLISILSFSLVLGGHIWVEDPVLEFQNAKDVNNIKRGTIWITFMLQSGLGPDDFIKITFPEIYLQMNALIYSSQKTLLNTHLLKDAANQDQIYGPPATSTIQPYYWTFGVSLAANTWYKLQLTFFNNILQTTASGQAFFNSPWTIATVSSYSDPDSIYYDENLSAGLIARAAPPVKFKNVNVTQSTPLYNSLLEAANDIYIDIDSTYAYDDGAFFEVTMNNNDYSFKTSCTSMDVTCSYPSATTCFNLTIVQSYTCNLQKVESTDSSTRQLLFEHKDPIIVGQGFRIKTTVQNPFYYTQFVGGIYVRSYSRQAKLWYEEALVLSKFFVTQILITDKLITYFWGLEGRAQNTSYRCPIGIYVTPRSTSPYFSVTNNMASNANIDSEYIVNKLRVYFQVTSQDFPAGHNYQLTVTINSDKASNMIYIDSSYSTNMPLVSGKRLMCKSDIINMQINCKNIGDAKAGSIYWFGVMFILLPNSLPASGFGAVTFKIDSTGTGVYNSFSVSQSSAGITPLFLSDSQNNAGTHTYNDFLSNYRVIDTSQTVGYGQITSVAGALANNKVVSIASDTVLVYDNNLPDSNFAVSTTTPGYFGSLVNAATGQSGIVYSSTSAFKILLLIEAAPELLCGISSAGNLAIKTKGCGGQLAADDSGRQDYFGGDVAADLLDLPSGFYAAHTVFKCIFNIAMISTYDTTQMQKGLQTFGGFWAGTTLSTACDYTGNTMCTVYPYDSYASHDKPTQDSNKLWNYIEQIIPSASNGVTLPSFGEATLSCNSIMQSTGLLSAKQYCSAVQFYATSQTYGPPNYDAKSPAIIFRNVKFATTFTGNPLYPNEKIFDFIICFRFVNPTTTFGATAANTLSNPGTAYIYGTQEGTIASYGIFQSTVVWIPQSTTYFKVGLVNYFNQNNGDSANLDAVMPSLIRFGGRFNLSDLVPCDALGLFVDASFFHFGNSELTTDAVPQQTNNIGCGAISASILCSYFAITGNYQTPFNNIDMYYPQKSYNVNNFQYIHFNQLTIFKGVYNGETEFNHFLPFLPDNQAFPILAMIGQFHETTTAGMYDTLNHFIRFSSFKNQIGYTDVTVSNYPWNYWNSGNLQPALGDGSATPAEINEAGTSGVCSSKGPAANSGTTGFINYLDDILPGKEANSTPGLQIDAALGGSSCPEVQANSEFQSISDNWNDNNIQGNGWGAAFSVSSQAIDPFPDATNFTWPYKQASGYPSNNCLKYNYLYYDLVSVYIRIYMITCPIDRWLDATGATCVGQPQPAIALDQNDQTSIANAIANLQTVKAVSTFTTAAGWILTVQPFTGPWNWGLGFNVNNVMSYAWSNKLGTMVYFRSPTQVNPWTGTNQQVLCSIGAIQSGWNRNGNAQMISITTTLKSVSIQLNYLTNQNVFTITEDFSTAVTSNDLISGYCTVQGIVNTCSVEQQSTSYVFTVTVSLIKLGGTQTMTVSAGTPFIINYWVNAKDQGPTVSVQHGAYIKGWNQMSGAGQKGDLVTINDCFTSQVGQRERTDYSGSTTTFSQQLSVSAPYYMYQDGKQKSYNYTSHARGWFDLEWLVSRSVYKFTQFQIDLSWIGIAQQYYKANMHCVPHSSQKVNFEFAALGITTMAAIDLKPKMGQWTNQKFDYSMSNKQFSIRCFGGGTPAAAPTTTQRPVVKWNIASTLITSGQTDDLSNKYSFNAAPDQLTSVLLTQKSWSARGSEAFYTFKFTPAVPYNLGARLIFEFSRAIPGRFNRGGTLECIQDGVPLYCFLISERTVTVLINKKLDNSSNPNYGYNITLRGVAQPDTLDAYKKIFVAIDLDQDFSNGLNFATEISENAVDATTNLKLLPVLQYSQSVSETLVTYTLRASLKMTKLTVIEDQVMYAQFPGYDYARAFFQGFTPICSLIRQGDINSVNYAKNCSFIGHRKIKIFMSLDNENQLNDLVYMVTISAVPTPLVPTTGGYVVEFILVDTSDFPISRSNKGYFNATPNGFNYNNLARLQWNNFYLQVYNGVYNAIGNFTQNDGLRFSKSFDYSFNGVNASSFRTYPKVVRGTAGNYWSSFCVGAEIITAPGYYQVLFDKVEDMTVNVDTYAIIAPLDLEVQPYQCTIGQGTNFDIVAGGHSLPIVFDFSGCLPLSDVTLAGNVTDYTHITNNSPNITIKGNPYFSVEFKFIPVSDPMNTLTTTFIQFDHNSVSDPALQNAAKVHVNLAGTNKLSYNAISDITLNVVAAPSFLPSISQLQADTFNGGVTLSFQCTLAGTMYWVLSTDYANLLAQNYTDSSISAQTVSLTTGLQQTIPDPNDRTFTIYGYTFMTSANTTVSVKVSNVASLRDYSVVTVCSALSGKTSSQRYANFTANDNNGRGIVLFGNFSAIVPKANLAKFVCALASQFRLTNNRVWTQYGQMCSIFRTRLLQNTPNPNITVVASSSDYVYAFIILPDYFASEDITYDEVKSAVTLTTFVSDVNAKLQPSFLGSATFTSVQQIRSKSFSLPGIPTFNSTTMNVGVTSTGGTVPFSLTNQTGFVFIVVGDAKSTKPHIDQLKSGQTGSGAKAVFADTEFIDQWEIFTVGISGLTQCTQYQWWFAASELDPTLLGYNSDVFTGNNFTTTGQCTTSFAKSLVSGFFVALFAFITFILA